MRDWTADKVRVPLTFTAEEVAELDELVAMLKTKTRMRLIRQALKFYGMLARYHSEGFLLQAINQGRLLQFPALDVPYPKETVGPATIKPVVPKKKRPSRRKQKKDKDKLLQGQGHAVPAL